MTTTTVENEGKRTEDNNEQSALRKFVVDALAELAGAEYVVLRSCDSLSGSFLVDCVALGADARPLSQEFQIPEQKDRRCWPEDPLNSWGVSDFPLGGLKGFTSEQLQEYSAGELAFIDSVAHKASFPLAMADSVVPVVLVTTSKTHPFRLSDIAKWWCLSQLLASSRCEQAQHCRFVSAVSQFNQLQSVESTQSLLGFLLHLITSGSGLGWNRGWILSQETDESPFQCQAAVGELNRDRWVDATCGRGDGGDLQAQLIALAVDQPYKRDGLWQLCCESEFLVDEDEFGTTFCDRFCLFENLSRPKYISTLRPLGSQLHRRWINELTSRAAAISDEYQRDDTLYGYPFEMDGRRHVVVVGHPYMPDQQTQTTLLLTTALIEFASASRRLGAVRTASTTAAPDDDSALGERFLGEFVQFVKHFSIPIELPSPSEFQNSVAVLRDIRQFQEDQNLQSKWLEVASERRTQGEDSKRPH